MDVCADMFQNGSEYVLEWYLLNGYNYVLNNDVLVLM